MAGSIQIKRMGWIRMPTAWEQTMQWREKQARVKERMAQLEAASAGFSAAAQNFISESGSLAVKAAIARNQAAAKAKAEALGKQQAEAKWDELI
jgi:hypothetical protein